MADTNERTFLPHNTIEMLCFLISTTPASTSITICYSMAVVTLNLFFIRNSNFGRFYRVFQKPNDFNNTGCYYAYTNLNNVPWPLVDRDEAYVKNLYYVAFLVKKIIFARKQLVKPSSQVGICDRRLFF